MLIHLVRFLSPFSIFRMYCIDKLCKFLILGLFVYYVGGAIFNSFFSADAYLSAETIIDAIDANASA